MEEKYIVYLHINKTNNKVYVGITRFTKNPNRRWRNGIGYKETSLIYKAALKYGWGTFSHVILCKTTKERACLLEQSLIKLCKSRGLSYNIGLGGEGAESFSDETKEKLKQYAPWIKGKHHTEKAKKKISRANKGHNNGMYGKHVSDYVKKLISDKFGKPVLQLDLNNNIINRFSSASKAERYLNGRGSHIGCCCLGKRKTAYGYKWKYE